ncbi:GDSL-type esterase/lipase family protein [Cohnella sp. 56]|uniref:GDSL-type esterase/lipase family protein n=1 Tax=Cohnella sp. 56 TaxID=3113722 RepID=UPI0030E8A30C
MNQETYPAMDGEKLDKLRNYRMLNRFAAKGQTVLVGSSLMEFFPINELQQTLPGTYCIYNRGIAGFVSAELLASMEACIFELEPSKIFINIGSNDVGTPDYRLERLLANYDDILTRIGRRLPHCSVYVMAYYPVNAKAEFPGVSRAAMEEVFRYRTNEALREANAAIAQLTHRHGYTFIDVNEGLMDEEGNLRAAYATDGIHMNPDAYARVLGNMQQYL